ncbi:homeotic protein knotted-1-like isoform X4 [Zingiber officinale]|uniref:homeotic protein knotted-1-like isoform X4 n=1 Tax=Zingiber officinale TaxID=94328 RepID=UPI001C4CEBC8|nr:homeotic protein knotted-1-like isoform X4 [Zingiber officinale]
MEEYLCGIGEGEGSSTPAPVPSYNYYHPYTSASPEEIKAKIMSHPKYSDLLAAFMDCQKVGAPPEVAARLSAMAHRLASDPTAGRSQAPPDPELDQFMDLYCDVLIKYQEELTRPLQEAKDFLNKIESQLNMLTNELLLSGAGSSDKDQDGDSRGEAERRDADRPAEDKELKQHLLKKYGSYLSGLRQELSKKKKKGRLPKDARQKLLNWKWRRWHWRSPPAWTRSKSITGSSTKERGIGNHLRTRNYT